MSQHEGVSCDSCLKRNFRGKRYKCLICLDYDLCSACHDAGTLSGRHTSNHPMQCILTRNDLDLFFAGEIVANDQPNSFTCPICGRLGFTDATLYDHVNVSHSDNCIEVVCPICATLPDGEPNQLTDDFLSHLNLEHRTNNINREIEEPQIVRIRQRHARMNNNRNRRSQFLNSTSATASTTASNRSEAIDPIAQLLSQLSDVRRVNSSSTSSTGQQNLWQFPFERQSNSNRSSLERILQRQRRQIPPTNFSSLTSTAHNNESASNSNQSMPYALLDSVTSSPSVINNNNNSFTTNSNSVSGGNSVAKMNKSNYLLNSCALMLLSENELKKLDTLNANRSIFVQELIFACLSNSIQIDRFLTKSTVGDDEIKLNQTAECPSNDLMASKSTSKITTNADSKELKEVNSNISESTQQQNQVISDDITGNVPDTVKLSNNEKPNKINKAALESETKSLENNTIIYTATSATTNNSTSFTTLNESDSQRQKSMPPLVQATGAPPGSFIVSSQTPVVTNHRNNKMSKVRSSPSIAPSAANLASLTLRHSSLTATAGGPGATSLNHMVSPNGRRKILKQQPTTEPTSHYD